LSAPAALFSKVLLPALDKGLNCMNILWLDQPAAQVRTLTGGKAAQLATLAAAERIPPGFVLTTVAYNHWRSTGVAGVSPTLPPELVAEIEQAYTALAQRTGVAQPVVAVRSSATGEDGRTASFAGQFATTLNVQGLAAVTAAIRACWQAAQSPQVLAYRSGQDLATAEGEMAVLVQQQINSEVAAVVFNVDPVTGAQTAVVEATWGLGDRLVSGQVTPDRFVVRQAELMIVDRQLAVKSGPATGSANGAGEAATPATHQAPALTDAQVLELAQLAMRLAGQLGWPVDLEYAYAGGQWYLLQCRPITTLPQPPAVTWDRPEDAGQSWLGGKEPVKPLQQSLSLHYYQGWAKAFRGVQARGGLRARFVNGYEYRLWQFAPQTGWAEVEAAQRAVARQLPQRWASEWLPAVQADLARWRALDLTLLPDDELAGHLHTMLAAQLHHWEIHAHLGSAPLETVQRLVDWYLARFPDAPESEPYRLVQGQLNVSVAANHQLWRLSNEVNFAVAEALRQEAWALLPLAFQSQFEAYLAHYSDGLAESRRHAAQLILRYVENEVPDPLVEVSRLAAERQAFTASVRAKLTPDEQPVFEDLLALALAHNPLTEDHNLYLDQQSDGATRRVCLEFGRRLAAAGVLPGPTAVDFLFVHELIHWGFGLAEPLAPRVQERQAAYAQQRRWSPPPFLGKPPEPASWVDRFTGPATPLPAEPGQLRGVGASAGVVRGPARVVSSLAEALALQPGEILVCPSTDPRWTPLFALAAALVTDHGGSLAHAAVVAREYRLPAVVGTYAATQQIQTGQPLEVDGLRGVVRPL
jgi:rifampicin phosphotransferase